MRWLPGTILKNRLARPDSSVLDGGSMAYARRHPTHRQDPKRRPQSEPPFRFRKAGRPKAPQKAQRSPPAPSPSPSSASAPGPSRRVPPRGIGEPTRTPASSRVSFQRREAAPSPSTFEKRRPLAERPFLSPKPTFIPDTAESEDSLPTAYLRPGEADRIVAGHPWVYEGSILRLTREPETGEVIQVKDHRRRLLGVGFYNPQSKIRVRVLSQERAELDESFLERRLTSALQHRKRFLPDATSFRVVNAEGDLLSGLIVDKYEDVLVLQISSAGMERRKTTLVHLLQKHLRPRAILERNDMGARRFEGLPETSGVLAGELADAEQRALPVRINGLRFEANLQSGHKTGLYLDQQVNQALVARFARGAHVLDAFSFIGGFALHAARAGAASVTGVDQSADAVATATRLAEANQLGSVCRFDSANAFDWLRAQSATEPGTHIEPRFDLIVLDPPSFTRNRAAVADALRGYKEIHLRALRLLRPGGILATFCCSHHVDASTFQAVILQAAYDAHRPLRRIESYAQAPDHPVLPAVPETEYLKGFAFEALAP